MNFPCLLVLLLGQHLLVLEVGLPFVQHNIRRKVKHLLKRPRRQVKNQPHTARNAFKVPDMRYRRSQGDMPHTLPAHARLRNLNAAAVAHDTFITDLFILSAVAFPVLAGSENPLAE